MPNLDVLYYSEALNKIAIRQRWPSLRQAVALLNSAAESPDPIALAAALDEVQTALITPCPGPQYAHEAARIIYLNLLDCVKQ